MIAGHFDVRMKEIGFIELLNFVMFSGGSNRGPQQRNTTWTEKKKMLRFQCAFPHGICASQPANQPGPTVLVHYYISLSNQPPIRNSNFNRPTIILCHIFIHRHRPIPTYNDDDTTNIVAYLYGVLSVPPYARRAALSRARIFCVPVTNAKRIVRLGLSHSLFDFVYMKRNSRCFVVAAPNVSMNS